MFAEQYLCADLEPGSQCFSVTNIVRCPVEQTGRLVYDGLEAGTACQAHPVKTCAALPDLEVLNEVFCEVSPLHPKVKTRDLHTQHTTDLSEAAMRQTLMSTACLTASVK